jgi:hypothetical protein
MSRTPNASIWARHEDEVLFTLIYNAKKMGLPIYECYRRASECFQEMDNCTDREPNACRQRWSKIKNDYSLLQKIDFNVDDFIPVTTGVQEEFNFENPISFNSSRSTETEEPVESKQQEEVNTIESSTNLFRELESILSRVEVKNLTLEAENANLKEELSSANNIIHQYEKELATFRQIRSLMQVGAK